MKVVNLLCKGRSLIEFNKLPNSDFVVLANDFDGEINEVENFSDYLKKQKIHQVLNMVFGGADGYNSINFFETYDVVKLIRPYLNGIRQAGSSGQYIPLEENFLGDNHKEFMIFDGIKYPYDYPGTGLAALAYTIVDCKPDVLNIVGMDFYDNLNYGISNYLIKCSEGRDYIRDAWTTEDMQKMFCKLIKAHPHIQVNMTTLCKSFIPEMSGVNNLNVNKIKYMEKN
jgi:hypothetical protein